ncbi:MAG TPA: glycosyltransferase, partial [Candidatus Wallbacteria bacterium]|nr:glycosyltransferase [Candidatus Wallbacteria bacterium]
EYNKCVKIAEQMNASSLIEFLGERPDALDIMAGCDIYVSASRREGLSMSMLEAAAIGMPILAPRVAGIAELVRPYEKGVMFENGDYESFKAGLAEIVEKYSEARNENVNETTAGFASKYEEHSNYIKKYEKLYIETINGL